MNVSTPYVSTSLQTIAANIMAACVDGGEVSRDIAVGESEAARRMTGPAIVIAPTDGKFKVTAKSYQYEAISHTREVSPALTLHIIGADWDQAWELLRWFQHGVEDLFGGTGYELGPDGDQFAADEAKGQRGFRLEIPFRLKNCPLTMIDYLAATQADTVTATGVAKSPNITSPMPELEAS